ncbi:unnamed protein product [Lactuca saligna]|uniref:Uncharacterized protein n=1 Tax=Lactuca saligna TaxID=75948 RepID=A0AA36A4R6_LACSI|nr:unnamed protein product [Lactuca saligna]
MIFFKLMDEVENADLVFTLDTIVDKFGEEMAPYTIGLCQSPLLHFGCVSILQKLMMKRMILVLWQLWVVYVPLLPFLNHCAGSLTFFSHIEPILLPIMLQMLTTDGQGWCQKACKCSLFPHLTTNIWHRSQELSEQGFISLKEL